MWAVVRRPNRCLAGSRDCSKWRHKKSNCIRSCRWISATCACIITTASSRQFFYTVSLFDRFCLQFSEMPNMSEFNPELLNSKNVSWIWNTELTYGRCCQLLLYITREGQRPGRTKNCRCTHVCVGGRNCDRKLVHDSWWKIADGKFTKFCEYFRVIKWVHVHLGGKSSSTLPSLAKWLSSCPLRL